MSASNKSQHFPGTAVLLKAALVGAFVLTVLALGADSAIAESAFCEKMVVHNYEKPFSRMPKVHPPPASGKLSFAPGHTYLTQPRSQVLVADEAPHIGYGFRSDPGADRTFTLNWLIMGRLSAISGRGELQRVVAVKRRVVGTVTEAEFNRVALRFLLPGQEGLYRFDLSFWRKNGERLKQYSQYFRVLRPTVAVRLAVDQQTIRSGDSLDLRVENYGSKRVFYGEPFSVEAYTGSDWIPYPVGVGPWHRPLFKILSGLAGTCQRFTAPTNTPPGLYRIRKDLLTPNRSVTANFEVLP